MTFSIMALSIMTQGMTTLSITTLGISTLSIEDKVTPSAAFPNCLAECRSVAYPTTAVIYECKKSLQNRWRSFDDSPPAKISSLFFLSLFCLYYPKLFMAEIMKAEALSQTHTISHHRAGEEQVQTSPFGFRGQLLSVCSSTPFQTGSSLSQGAPL